MVVADISGKPAHYWVQRHKAAAFQCGFCIVPVSIVLILGAGEIMLRIKQIRSQHMAQKEGHKESKEPGKPAKVHEQKYGYAIVYYQHGKAVPVFALITHERLYAHAEHKCGKISKEHIQPVAHSQVKKAFLIIGLHKLLLGHQRKRADAGAEQFGIIGVMVIVTALPDAGRSDHIKAKCGKQHIGNKRFLKYAMVLVVVKDNEHTGQHTGTEYTAGYAPQHIRHVYSAQQSGN